MRPADLEVLRAAVQAVKWACAAAAFTASYAATYGVRDEHMARLGAAGLFVPAAELERRRA